MKALFYSPFLVSLALAQVVITDSGSTNRQGETITIGDHARAARLERGGIKTEVKLPAEMQSRLLKDLETAPSLDQLNVSHCMKSASFGSRTYLTYKGVRSPDLSCPQQSDPVAAALHQDVENLMTHIHGRSGLRLTPRDSMGPR